MKFQFRNRVALITGASKGIGFSIANTLANYGCSVILLSRNRGNLKSAINQLSTKNGQKHYYIEADLSQISDIVCKVGNLLEDINKLDIIINNSSGPLPLSFAQCTKDDYMYYFNQIFLSATEITRLGIAYMKRNKYGRIVNITGTSTVEPIEGMTLSSIKSIYLTWAKSISKELGPYNITVNNVLPGPTDTNELKKVIDILSRKNRVSYEEYTKMIINSMAIKRIAKPEEIANLVLFLVSEYASFITGSNFKIDGGYTKGI